MTPDSGSSSNQRNFFARIWRSIFRRPVLPADDRDRKWIVFNTLLLHLRPIKVPLATLRFTHTFGLGGMSLVLVLLLVGTGALLMFAYEPAPERAYDSVVDLEGQILFGGLVRGMHYWSANLVIVVVVLHLLRVFLTGGFHGPRQFNWILGLGLLLCLLASNFTGYLLPWDQLSYWAVTIVTGMVEYVPLAGQWLQRTIRGGSEIGTATMINFYTLHTTMLPVSIFGLMAFHFWRVRKAGGVVVPGGGAAKREGRPERVLFLPHLLLRETAVALVLVAVVIGLAIVFGAPLGERANPGMSPDPAKSPWYFLGFQELLFHFHPLFAVVVIPLLAAAGLAVLPYLRYDARLEGDWFLTSKGRRMSVVAALVGLVAAPLAIVADELLLGAGSGAPGLPFAVAMTLLVVFYAVVARRFEATRNESVQALFVLLAVSFAILTVTGLWFRGPGMALTWPWNL